MNFALFPDDNKLLPGYCKPYADEILSSWLTRMAFDHGLTTREFCSLVLPDGKEQNYDIDRMITSGKIEVLAQKTNCTSTEVYATTLFYYIDRLFTSANLQNNSELWLLPSKRTLYSKRKKTHSSGLMFCPLCLKKKAYFKKQWRLVLSFICVDCGCYLLDRCPHCERGNSFMDVNDFEFLKGSLDNYLLHCHHCNGNITDCSIEMASVNMIQTQRQLYYLIDHEILNPSVSKKSYLSALSFLCRVLVKPLKKAKVEIGFFVQDVYQLNSVNFKEHLGRASNDLRYINIRARADIIGMAHWLLCKWPGRFINLCRNNNVQRNDILCLFSKPPGWFHQPVWEELITDTPEPCKQEKRRPHIEECTARPLPKRIKIVDYDFAMGECYDEDELYYESALK